MSQRKGEWGGRLRAWNGGNSIPSALSKWWMCYDGPAPAQNMSLTQRQKKHHFTALSGHLSRACTQLSSVSLFLCFILSLTANDRWRLCRSSKVIEDWGYYTEEPCLFVFDTFSVWLSFVVSAYSQCICSYDLAVSVKMDRSPQMTVLSLFTHVVSNRVLTKIGCKIYGTTYVFRWFWKGQYWIFTVMYSSYI